MTDPMVQLAITTAAAGATVKILELLKNWPWFKPLSQHTKTINRAISVVVALLSAGGFTYQFSAGSSLETGGSITLSFPPLSVFLEFLGRFGYSIMTQEGYYQNVQKPDKPPVLVEQSPSGTINVTAPPPGAVVVVDAAPGAAIGVSNFDRWFSRFREEDAAERKKGDEDKIEVGEKP